MKLVLFCTDLACDAMVCSYIFAIGTRKLSHAQFYASSNVSIAIYANQFLVDSVFCCIVLIKLPSENVQCLLIVFINSVYYYY